MLRVQVSVIWPSLTAESDAVALCWVNRILGGGPCVVGSGADLPDRPTLKPPLRFTAPLRLGSGPRHEYLRYTVYYNA